MRKIRKHSLQLDLKIHESKLSLSGKSREFLD